MRVAQPRPRRGSATTPGQVPGIDLTYRGQQQRIGLRTEPHRRTDPPDHLIIGQRPQRLPRGSTKCLTDPGQPHISHPRGSGNLDQLTAHNPNPRDRV